LGGLKLYDIRRGAKCNKGRAIIVATLWKEFGKWL